MLAALAFRELSLSDDSLEVSLRSQFINVANSSSTYSLLDVETARIISSGGGGVTAKMVNGCNVSIVASSGTEDDAEPPIVDIGSLYTTTTKEKSRPTRISCEGSVR